ncbi:MAG: RNA pseudouridine synthase [Rickettsiales bacterium]|nr:RNA pseudouridine synthase [Rickettsiales bacterium]
MTPEELTSLLIYRDALMLVLNKPAGLPVHKGTGGGVTLDRHFDALRFGLPRPPALAHRLDRDTSGCLVLGRNRHALNALGKHFANGRIEKTYWAIVEGIPAESEGVIDQPLAKQSEASHRWWMKVEEGGMPALTHYRVLGSREGVSWLELKPKTGRTHQLRVHCAHIGHPILADRIYGAASDPTTLHLHAREVTIPLYPKKPPITVTAPPPAHMLALLQACGYRE